MKSTHRSPGEGGLAPEVYRDLVRQALTEDRGRGDATSAATIAADQRARGTILAKSDLVVAGIDVAAETFRQVDPAVVFQVRWGDGSRVQRGEVVAVVQGRARALLEAERTALNFLQRLCGIARAAIFRERVAHQLTVGVRRQLLRDHYASTGFNVICTPGSPGCNTNASVREAALRSRSTSLRHAIASSVDWYTTSRTGVPIDTF